MTEPDVALTDFGLAILCGWIVFNLSKQAPHFYRNLWIAFFASVCAGSLIGGLVHGFFLDQTTLASQLLWRATLLSIGITAASCWVLAGYSLLQGNKLTPFVLLAILLFVIYAIIVIFISQKFLIAIIDYVPAITVLLFASMFAYIRDRIIAHLWICFGIIIAFIAAAIQQMKIAIHPVYFNHNAFYHVLQAIGLIVLFAAAKRLLPLSWVKK